MSVQSPIISPLLLLLLNMYCQSAPGDNPWTPQLGVWENWAGRHSFQHEKCVTVTFGNTAVFGDVGVSTIASQQQSQGFEHKLPFCVELGSDLGSDHQKGQFPPLPVCCLWDQQVRDSEWFTLIAPRGKLTYERKESDSVPSVKMQSTCLNEAWSQTSTPTLWLTHNPIIFFH